VSTRLFCSWVRRGAAAGITEPDPIVGPFTGPATFEPSVTLALNGAAGSPIPGPNLPLLGPGAIVGFHPNAIVRVDPAPGATCVEDNFLPLLELARPDLPWLFTPAKPNAANRLRPWILGQRWRGLDGRTRSGCGAAGLLFLDIFNRRRWRFQIARRTARRSQARPNCWIWNQDHRYVVALGEPAATGPRRHYRDGWRSWNWSGSPREFRRISGGIRIAPEHAAQFSRYSRSIQFKRRSETFRSGSSHLCRHASRHQPGSR
jgi:hypothetical protein